MTPLAATRVLGRCLARSEASGRQALHSNEICWSRLIEVANRALLTPALYAALAHKQVLDLVPADVRGYLAELHRRNCCRNERLHAQVCEIIAALNRSGIEPMLVKGAATLLECPAASALTRMVTDLDILIEKSAIDRAIIVLDGLGYRRSSQAAGAHAVGDFVRANAAGAIDLHVELIADSRLLPAGEALRRAVPRRRCGVAYKVLDPTDRVLHLLLHDLLQDYGFFDGRLNFRHLHDLSTWMTADEPIDWPRLTTHLKAYRLVPMLEFWLLAATRFFVLPTPPAMRLSAIAHPLLWRSLLLLRYPRLARASEIIGNVHRSLAWYRIADPHDGLPRLRRAVGYLRKYRSRTVARLLHVVFYHRS